MLYLFKNLNGLKIGLIKEGKTPPDKRVPLSPKQCKWINNNYKKVDYVCCLYATAPLIEHHYIQLGYKSLICLLYTSDAADE